MSNPADISPEDFAALCRGLELELTAEERERLHEAYRGLKVLLARLPRDKDFFPEPATVFAPAGTRLAR